MASMPKGGCAGSKIIMLERLTNKSFVSTWDITGLVARRFQNPEVKDNYCMK